MKLKLLINYLLAAVLITGVSFTVSSCKDNDSDLMAQLREDDANLQAQIDALNRQINDLNAKLIASKQECYDAIMDEVNQLLANYVTHPELTEALAEYVKLTELESRLGNYYTKAEIDALLAAISQCECMTKEELLQWLLTQGLITQDELNNYYTKGEVDSKIANFVTLNEVMTAVQGLGYQTAADVQNAIETALAGYLTMDKLNELIAANSNFSTLVEALTTLSTVDTNLSTLSSQYQQFLTQYEQDQQALEAYKQQLTEDLLLIAGTLEDLQIQINAITGRLNKLITGIVCQQVFNPVFGVFSLPVDVQSNVLLGFYGNPDNEGQFPDSDTVNAYNGNDGNLFTDADYTFLAANCALTPYTYTGSTKFFNGDQTAGKVDLGYVYLTVNPIANDFTGVTMSLENSQGNASAVALAPIKPSTDLLTFGYSRGESANGFYESQATVNINDVSQIKVEIQEGLKSAVRDVWQNKTYSDLAQLGKLVYRQIDGFLPALALRAGWMDGTVANAVYSQYNVAATAYKPLSFSFAYDKSFRHNWHIPDSWWTYQIDMEVPTTRWDIQELNVSTPNVSFHLPRRTVSYSIYDDRIEVTIDMPHFSAGAFTGVSNELITIPVITDFMAAYKTCLHNLMAGNEGAYAADFFGANGVEAQIVDQMQQLYDDGIINVEYKVTDNLETVVYDIQDQVNSKISKFTKKLDRFRNKIEAALSRINSFLSDPNHYLQPVMLYGNDASYYKMSEAKTWPTQVEVAGGNAITLIATTYNAEIVVPCYKKFVAVTDVYTADGSARLGNAGCLTALKKANSQPYMCEPFDGRRITFPLYVEKVGGKDTTYEIVYQGIDYHGKISTIKSYITVK